MKDKLSIDVYHYLSAEEFGSEVLIGLASVQCSQGIGGCRMIDYNTDEEAMNDLIALVASMQNKSLFHDLNLSGAKCVVNKNCSVSNRTKFFYELGRKVENLKGKYIVAMDSGTNQEDMNCIRKFTEHTTNYDEVGGSPSSYTAMGVFSSIEELSARVLRKKPENTRISIQGVGNVGLELLKLLLDNNYMVTITDSNDDVLSKVSSLYPEVDVIDPNSIYSIESDIFAPCALGGVINMKTIQMLKCRIICGAANSQLSSIELAHELKMRDIIFIPDELVNVGGLLWCSYQYFKDKEIYNKIYSISEMVSSFAEYCISKDIEFTDAVQDIYKFPYYGKHNSTIVNKIEI